MDLPHKQNEDLGRAVDTFETINAMQSLGNRIQGGMERFGWSDRDVREALIGGLFGRGHRKELESLVSELEEWGSTLTTPLKA